MAEAAEAITATTLKSFLEAFNDHDLDRVMITPTIVTSYAAIVVCRSGC